MGENSESKMNAVLFAILAAFIGIVLFVALTPTMVDQIGSLTGTAATKYGPILYVIPTVAAAGVIIGVVKFFTGPSR